MKSYDIAIVGGGIFGLSIARECVQYGLKTILIEKNRVASGASNGLVGALMPHVPTRWNDKKQFQFDALNELSALAEQLKEATGLSLGYARTGRLMPLYTQDKYEYALEREKESKDRWHTETTGFSFKVLKESPFGNWLTPESAPLGFVFDNFAARANPRAYCTALKTYLLDKITILEGTEFNSFDEKNGRVILQNGESISAKKVVISAGYEGFDLISNITEQTIGTGVKGQSLLLELDLPANLPVIYDDGIYVIAHENGRVALGSTSENDWQDKDPHDADLNAILAKALVFCPQLKGARVIDTWAGIRPKCKMRDPIVGTIPGHEDIYVATGGFKISYGIAHRIAAALLEEITMQTQRQIMVPASFRPESHFKQVT
ncbi:NAD(P)/FAD-dependent oxidoreductase [Polycladidibacter stylochi]|uniref:NAD(P)/FAD-dependent oxidoreductase n=1 Tax=Polycladidibacter stylochi TaxID=1807766 RepID=UPI000832D798|nr:FAD-dependent oxidoreductase [Pseudovibrio stylochi]